ncbi:hypothetical protein M8C21_010239 [Ambrosia artemisiifolia]|uniref:Uncharacterized protein n=1 Tax=Ambrosia artemisiifolia TaxID=4212 RepID=A0AAD5G6J3_AMBAR|nr:hypothetical protein M8C21_010239 [Ambrosia artemisiifolia]
MEIVERLKKQMLPTSSKGRMPSHTNPIFPHYFRPIIKDVEVRILYKHVSGHWLGNNDKILMLL